MKFKEMDSVTKFRAMGRLAPVLAAIGKDQAVSDALTAFSEANKEKKGRTNLQNLSLMMEFLAPPILTGHAEELCEITSIMTGKTLEEVTSPGNDIIADVLGFFDGDFANFFMRSGHTAKSGS